MTMVPDRFYRQVTYYDQLQAYVFIDTRALVPAKSSMYVMNQQKEILDTIQRLGNLGKLGWKIVNG